SKVILFSAISTKPFLMKKTITLLLLMAFACFTINGQTIFNGGFESVSAGKPTGWLLSYAPSQDLGYLTALDSTVSRSGKYAMTLEKLNDKASYAAIGYTVHHSFEGKTVEVRGYIKT